MRNLFRATRVLVGDLAGTLLFAVLLAAGVHVLAAAAAGVALTGAMVALNLVRKQEVGAIQWLSLVLMALFGVAVLFTDVTFIFGYVWAGLMFLTAILNMVVVMWYIDYWLAFLAVFPIVSKLVLFGIHFGISVVIAKRRQRLPTAVT